MGEFVAASLQLIATAVLDVGLALWVGALASAFALRAGTGSWRDAASARQRSFFPTGVALCGVGSLLALWWQAAAMADASLGDAWPAVWPVLRETHYGHAWLAGIAALGLAGIGSRSGSGSARVVSLAGVAAFAASRSLQGHAAADGGWMAPAVDWVHLMSVSAWSGEVFVAAAVLAVIPSTQGADRHACASYVERLSATATWALVAVVATGVVNAWRGLDGSPQALLASRYGAVLDVKVGLVAVAVALGGFNRWSSMPPLLTALRSPRDPSSLPLLRRFTSVMKVESVVLLIVLVVAAVLSTSAPVSSS